MTHDRNAERSVNRRQFLGTAATGAAIGIAGCTGGSDGSGDGGSGSNALHMGILTDFSGPVGFLGPSTEKGIEVVTADIEEAGGVTGTSEVKVSSADSELNPSKGLSGFQNLESKGVQSITGVTSVVISNLITPIQEAGVSTFVPAGSTEIDNVAGHIWRLLPSDNIGGLAQAKYMSDQGYENIVVANVASRGPQSFSTNVARSFRNLGGTVIDRVRLNPGAGSYRSQLEEIKSKDPDAVSMTGGVDATLLFLNGRQEVDANFPVMIANDATSDSIFEEADNELFQGVTGQQASSGPSFKRYRQRWNEVHGDSAPAPASNTGYDAGNLVALAAEKAGTASRTAVQDNIRSIATPPGKKVTNFVDGKSELENGNEIDYQGAATACNYDDRNNVLGSFTIRKAQNGKFVKEAEYSSEELSDAAE
jgi:branched-chain amino acid transport system substrate-binding protein